jgi:hypothetical protein
MVIRIILHRILNLMKILMISNLLNSFDQKDKYEINKKLIWLDLFNPICN